MTSRAIVLSLPILPWRAGPSCWILEGCAATMLLLGMGRIKVGEVAWQLCWSFLKLGISSQMGLYRTQRNSQLITGQQFTKQQKPRWRQLAISLLTIISLYFGGILSKRWKEIGRNNVSRRAIAQQEALHQQNCQAQGEWPTKFTSVFLK